MEEGSGLLAASGLQRMSRQIRDKASHRATAGSMGQLRLLVRSNGVDTPSQFDVNRALGGASAGSPPNVEMITYPGGVGGVERRT